MKFFLNDSFTVRFNYHLFCVVHSCERCSVLFHVNIAACGALLQIDDS